MSVYVQHVRLRVLCLTFAFFFSRSLCCRALVSGNVCVFLCGGSKREMMLQKRGESSVERGNHRFVSDGVCMMSVQVKGPHSAHVDIETIIRGSLGLSSLSFFLFPSTTTNNPVHTKCCKIFP